MKAITFMFAVSGVVLVLALWTPAASTSPSRNMLEERFDADLRYVAIAWSPDDARPEAVRRKALFEFVYQTYDASAWIPQSLFDGNIAMQVIAVLLTAAVIGAVFLAKREDVPDPGDASEPQPLLVRPPLATGPADSTASQQ